MLTAILCYSKLWVRTQKVIFHKFINFNTMVTIIPEKNISLQIMDIANHKHTDPIT